MHFKDLFKIHINSKRIYGLDILRAFAILFVVVGHGQYLLPDKYNKIHAYIVFDGVSIFFVLSGFLIGGILLKILREQKLSRSVLFDFWKRRWFRTVPNYLLILSLLILLNILFSDNFNISEVKNYFVFSQNLFTAHPHFFPEAWSLSVEEWFYLLIPIIILFLIKVFRVAPKNALILTSLLILFSVTTFRYYKFLNVPIETLYQWDLLFRKQVFTRLDSLMFGIIGAYLQYYFSTAWQRFRVLLLWTGLLLFVLLKIIALNGLLPVNGLFNCVFSFSITSLATLFLLPFLSNLRTGKGYLFYFFTYISLISYSMYLLNLSVVQFWILDNINLERFQHIPYLNVIVMYSLYWILTIFLSIILYKYFEMPIMKLRDRKPSVKEIKERESVLS